MISVHKDTTVTSGRDVPMESLTIPAIATKAFRVMEHDCHKWARCTNGIFNYSCHCNQGFQGNGTHCDDVDECKQIGGMNGHHCPLENGRCINQEGGYTC